MLRNPNTTGQPSLFPFLAVLLCTMGALVMLLVVVARNVREQSAAQAALIETEIEITDPLEKLTPEEADAILEQIRMGSEEADWFAQEFLETKTQFSTELEEKKTQLALLEKETQKVKDELQRLAHLAKQLETAQHAETNHSEPLKQRLEQLKKQREAEELELAELQTKAAKDAKSYAVIPYQGTSGTFRRPIYIECRGDRVILQPEGVELYPNDFILADRPDNPFDAVLRVIRQYYIETGQIVRGVEPYPLLIVRPSGSETYATTRKAISTWIKEFGYELVDEGWNVEYPQPSAELKARIEKQLEASRVRMSGYLAAMRAAGAAEAMNRAPQQYRVDQRGRVASADSFLSRYDRNGGASTQRSPGPFRGTAPEMDSVQPGPRPFGSQSGNSVSNNSAPSRPAPNIFGQKQPGQPSSSSDVSLSTEQNSQAAGESPIGVVDTKTPQQTEQVVEPGMLVPGAANSVSTPTNSPALPPGIGEQPASSKIAERKANWALQGATAFLAPMSRTIKIQCAANQFVIPPQSGQPAAQAIPIDGSIFSATEKLVAKIKECMDGWGMAGENMYWRPVLSVTVLPGGEPRFAELRHLLRNSGLVVEQVR